MAMSYRSLRDFIARLEADGELVRVREPVSTVLEMTEIQTRLIAEGGPAVIFEKPVKADGTPSSHARAGQSVRHRQARRHGRDHGQWSAPTRRDLREVGELLAQLRQPQPPRSFGEAMELLPLVKTVMAMKPKTVSARLPGDRAGAATTSILRACRSRPAGRASRRR
jgi:4-hydroxy-3-polyprenylbenzoate decarboxylase